MASNEDVVTASLTAADTFTDWLQIKTDVKALRLSISGTWTDTLTVQRRTYGTSAGPFDVQTFGSNVELRGYWPQGEELRIGFKSGTTPTGTAVITMAAHK